MINRRVFSKGIVSGALALAAPSISSRSHATATGTPTQNALVIDAMGEIREVYTDSLCREMIDSGLNSVTVTLCDPKSFESVAYEWGMDGVLQYDRLIAAESDFWMKATSVADIHRAREQGKIALFYLFHGRFLLSF